MNVGAKMVRGAFAAIAIAVSSGTMAAEATTDDLVAFWPFGEYGLNDASGNGHVLSAGQDVSIDDFASFAGSANGNLQSFLTANDIPFAEMDEVSIEVWIRYQGRPGWAQDLFELSPNFNENYGAFDCYWDLSALYAGRRKTVQAYSLVGSSSDVLGTKFGEWRHLVVVLSRGAIDRQKLYVDGVDVTAVILDADTTDLPFVNDTLYFGGRATRGTFVGEMDSIKVWSRALTKAEVESGYTKGPSDDGGSGLVVLTTTGRPENIPCSQMFPDYGTMFCNCGTEIVFSATCEVDGIVIAGWNIYTNAPNSSDPVLMLSGDGTVGSFICPDAFCNLEWQFNPVASSIVDFISPLETTADVVSFSCYYYCANESAESVRILALSGGSPTGLTTTNELGVVTSSVQLQGAVSRLSSSAAMCVKLIVVDQSGKLVASSRVKVSPPVTTDLVAWWPFGECELDDACGSAYSLTKGDEVTIGEFANFKGTAGGNSQSVLSVSGIPFETMGAVTIETWVRLPSVPSWSQPLFELSPNYNNKSGVFLCSLEPTYVAIASHKGENNASDTYAFATSGENVMAEKVGEWRHVAAVYPQGPYGSQRLYVDGVDVTTDVAGMQADMTGVPFQKLMPLYFGSHDNKGTFSGDMDSMQIWSRVLSANEIEYQYKQGRDGDPRIRFDGVLVEVPEGCSADQVFPPAGMTCGYALGETIPLFIDWADAGKFDCVLQTNDVGSAKWVDWRRMPNAVGEFEHPGVAVKVSWRKHKGLCIFVY